ncbi:MAG TPA: hypothetical protein VFM93_07940 [Candidatus Limnocylindria bacterium]|nr:hypothetical protein [Candidatus Limnocylindria bacterium]
MRRHTLPKTILNIALTVIALVVALYATSVATAGVAAAALGDTLAGIDLISWGTATIIAAVATAAAFTYLAITSARGLLR